jgi:hypothetical protein
MAAETSAMTRVDQITIESVVDSSYHEPLWALYLEAFGPLRTLAAARQVLHHEEFIDEMTDPRVIKYVAWDEEGNPEAMATLTSDLTAVPWISPEYYAARYPEHTSRQAVYYWGFALARPDRHSSFLFRQIFVKILTMLAAEKAIVAYDICRFNNHTMRFAQQLETVGRRFADVTVENLDSQSYYSAAIS